MSKIEAIIPNIHGFNLERQEVGGEIAEVYADGKTRYVRFSCIYQREQACPLREGIKRGNCDAENFQGRGRYATPWESPVFTVGCGRTRNIKDHPPNNLKERFPSHKFPSPSARRHRWGKIVE